MVLISAVGMDTDVSFKTTAADCTLDTPSLLSNVTPTIQLLCDSWKLSRGMEKFCCNSDSLVVEKELEQRGAAALGTCDIDLKLFL